MGKESRPDWVIHYVSNNAACDICKKQENSFPDYICDAHTHGMDKYDHLEFQVVIDLGLERISYALNMIGFMVREGKKFKNGDRINNMFVNLEIELFQTVDTSGEPILRLIFPDGNMKMPNEAEYPYNMQLLTTAQLHSTPGNPVS